MQTFLCIYFGINLFIGGYVLSDTERGKNHRKLMVIIFLLFGVPLIIYAFVSEYWTQIKAFFVEVAMYILEAIDLVFRGIIIVFTFFVLWIVASGFFKTCL